MPRKNTSAPRATWNSSCDAILIETLEKEKNDGRMTSNSSWHNSVWTEAEKALDGTEVHSGGGKKTGDSCHNRWTAVTLKKEYIQVKVLCESSGFGWDEVKQLVTATEEVWAAFLDKRKQFTKWRKTPFPLYDSMHDLVNGTVATGAGAFRPGRDSSPVPDNDLDASYESEDFSRELSSQCGTIDPILDESQSSDPITSDEATDSTTIAAPAPSTRKRPANEHPDAAPAKRSRKTLSAPAAISDVASSVRDLASAFTSSGGQPSPQRRTAAVKVIEEDDDLSENEQLKIFKILRKDVAVADFILAIKDKGKRTRYLQSELDDL